jgi:hypothetical protein
MGTLTVSDSCIFPNVRDSVVIDPAAGTATLSSNWWGSADGPGATDADDVSGTATTAPHLAAAPAICATVPPPPFTLDYEVTGTATAGVDYTAMPDLAGSFRLRITVTPVNDGDTEGDETVMATILASSAYTLGDPAMAVVTIVDDGVLPDAGTPEEDAGAPEEDAGTPGADSGPPPPRDGGSGTPDSGMVIRGGGDSGGCCTIAAGARPRTSHAPMGVALTTLALALLRARRRRL